MYQLKSILPNERVRVSQWIFTIVLSSLFPRYLLSQVKATITDACPQEFMQIDMVREIYFKNALRIRCGIHLVQMGWTHHVDKKNCYSSSVGVFYDNICNHLKAWIYSWMKSSCETRKEFLVSKLSFKNSWIQNKTNPNWEKRSSIVYSPSLQIILNHMSLIFVFI